MAGLFIKLDCDYWDHPRIVRAGVMAGVLYQRMSMYCMQHTTDGIVPAAQLPRFALPGTGKLTAALVDAGLIEPHPDGWLVPGYVERYPSAAELEQRRQTSVVNGRKGGRPRKNPEKTQGVSGQVPSGLRDTKPSGKQEVEVDVEVEVDPPHPQHGSAARAPAPDDEDDLPTELLRIAGYPQARPTDGERATVATLLRRGWTPDHLRAMALRASTADVDARAYLLKLLGEALNSDPPPPAAANRVDPMRGRGRDGRSSAQVAAATYVPYEPPPTIEAIA